MISELTVKQLKIGGFDDNFSYLVFAANDDAAIIDPCGDTEIIKSAFFDAGQLRPRYILLTHGHRDHTSGIGAVKKFFAAPLIAHPNNAHRANDDLSDRQQLQFGSSFIEAIFTPGHTNDSVCYRLGDDSALFTGDTLFIDYCGYCQPKVMFNTLRQIIFPLAGSNIIYSGHDYGRTPCATLAEEKQHNPYLCASDFQQFEEELRNL